MPRRQHVRAVIVTGGRWLSASGQEDDDRVSRVDTLAQRFQARRFDRRRPSISAAAILTN